jgi:hypothetical protein
MFFILLLILAEKGWIPVLIILAAIGISGTEEEECEGD